MAAKLDPLHGILWAGNATEVQRMDLPEDAEGNYTDPVYEGDMEAALALAEITDAHWLVYYDVLHRDHTDHPSYMPWAVHAFDTLAEAVEHGLSGAAPMCFAWDGRKGAPPAHPSGNGFLPHPESIAVVGVWKDWPEAATVEPYYEAYLSRRQALVDAGRYPYNDDFLGHIGTVTGVDHRGKPLTESMAIYLCQTRFRMEEIKAKVMAKLAEGYVPLHHLPGHAVTKFKGVVLVPTRNMGGEYRHFADARLVPQGSVSQAEINGHAISGVLPKGKRTHGVLVMDRRVLVLR